MKFLLIAALLAKLTAQSPDAKNDTSRFPGVWELAPSGASFTIVKAACLRS